MFNEAERVEAGVGAILSYLGERHPGTEVILVDDGSTDGTAEVARALLLGQTRVSARLVVLDRNRGKGGAVREGLLQCRGAIRAFVDADNATPIEELDQLLPLVGSAQTVVIGSRGIDRTKISRRQSWWREGMGRGFNLLLRLAVGLPYRDTQCGFKLFGQRAAEVCFSRQTVMGFAFDVELLCIARSEGFPVVEVPVRWRHVPRSRVRLVRDSLMMARDAWSVRRRLRRPSSP